MNQKKVLIVDDSQTIRTLVSLVLKKSNFEVIEAVDGNDGLLKLKEHPNLNLIISDVNMPNLGGIEMVQRMNSEGNKIPILMLTTEGTPDLISQAKEAGVKGWLVKPIKPEQLSAAVTKVAA